MHSADQAPLNAALKEAISSSVDLFGETLAKRLLRHATAIVKARRGVQCMSEVTVDRTWAEALDLYEVALHQAERCGAYFSGMKASGAKQCGRDHKFDALVGLHRNAVRVAAEILHLLRGGYASGAHARWRALHEIAVIAGFIARESPEVAERFLDHEAVKRHESVQACQEHCALTGQPPLPQDLSEAATDAFEAALRHYGQEFAGRYGWAKAALQQENPNRKGSVTFEELEGVVGMRMWRSPYALASHSVHITALSLSFNIGCELPSEMNSMRSTTSGLGEPGVEAMLTLLSVMDALAIHAPILHKAIPDSVPADEWAEVLVDSFYPVDRLMGMADALRRIVEKAVAAFAAISAKQQSPDSAGRALDSGSSVPG